MTFLLDALSRLDAPLRVSFSLSLHSLALLVVGTLALVVAADTSCELGRRDSRWRWFGWFALLKGLSIITTLSLGVAYGWASPDFFRSCHLLFALPAWLAAANFAWSSWTSRPAISRPLWLWLAAVGVAGATGGLAALALLEHALTVGIGAATVATLGAEILTLTKQRRRQAASSLFLLTAGLAGLVATEASHPRFVVQVQGWTANTLDDFTYGNFRPLHTATAFACVLSLGWWLWMRLHVNPLARSAWLCRALWLIPCGQLALCVGGVSSLNNLRREGAARADLVYARHARTAALGLELVRDPERQDPARLGEALGRLVRDTPDFEVAALVRIDGARITALAPRQAPLPERITLWRKGGADDPRPARREAFVSSFMRDARGTFQLCCEPWPDGDDQWLVFRVDYRSWSRMMGPMLGQATIIVLLACMLGVTVIVLFIRHELANDSHLHFARASAASKAKSELLALTSHELRTPIQGMLGYADLLSRSDLDRRQAEWLRTLRTQGGHLLHLVNDLLDYGALQNGRLSLADATVSPFAVAHEALSTVRPLAEARHLSCNLHLARDLPTWVRADPNRLRQILVNLLGNAVKFTTAGGVTLRIDCQPGAPIDTRRHLRFAVTDTGPGIAPEDIPNLFDPALRWRSDTHTEGAGLGLPLTRSLCQLMGGDLHVESTPGQGSTFTATLSLPPAEPPAAAPAAGSAPHELPALGLRVLVVEDNPALRLLLATWLDALRCSSALAEDGERALALAAKEPFDAVILDLGLPDLDGRDVAQGLRATPSPRPLRIVGLSAHASEADRTSALAAGMDVFLSKPVQLDALAAALQATPSAPGAIPPPASGGLLASPLLASAQGEAIRALARQELSARHAELQAALAAGDLPRVARVAHYLANTFDLLGATEARAACIACEKAARAGDAARARDAAELIAPHDRSRG